MIISKVLLKDLITNHITQGNGLNEVLEITLNAMMKHEHSLNLGYLLKILKLSRILN